MAKGYTDTDKGMKDILAEIQNLKSMCVKVGVTDDVGAESHGDGGPTLAQIATWNELGVLARRRRVKATEPHGDGKWFIPPRPFVRGFADNKREEIADTLAKLMKLVSGGKLNAEDAIAKLGIYGQSGVRKYLRDGSFAPNADSTIARKGSSKPLINTGTLRNSIRYQVIHEPVEKVGGK